MASRKSQGHIWRSFAFLFVVEFCIFSLESENIKNMSLWVDKYRPTSLQDLDYHKLQAEQLKNLVQQDDFPHLLVYGSPGAGKKTRIMCLLREMFGAGVERLRQETIGFTTASNKKMELSTVRSDHHYECNPSDVGMYDRIAVLELIKSVAQTNRLDASQKDFKVLVISQADRLTTEAQHALRRTMEKYAASCRIVLCANSTSRFIPAIRSRCLAVRVPAPTTLEIQAVLKSICRKENIALPPELSSRLADKSERNLRLAVLMLEDCKVRQFPLAANQEIVQLDWKVSVRDMCQAIINEQSPKVLAQTRASLYELLTRGIPTDTIFKVALDELTRYCCDVRLKRQVVSLVAQYEQRSHLGNKPVFHLEAFVARFMSAYKQFMEETLQMIM